MLSWIFLKKSLKWKIVHRNWSPQGIHPYCLYVCLSAYPTQRHYTNITFPRERYICITLRIKPRAPVHYTKSHTKRAEYNLMEINFYIAIPRLWGFWYFFKKIVLLPRDIQCNNHVSAWKLVHWGNYYPNNLQGVSSHSDPRSIVLYIAIQRLWFFW